MAKKKAVKTNALRLLDRDHVSYRVEEYDYDEEHLSGEHIIDQVSLNGEDIYKTLVLQSDDDRSYLVCCIPVLENIDLKKLAKLSGHKKVEMIHMKDLLNVTGYIRGGCSPVGMKKKFPTFFDETVILYDKITVSAGVKGCQLMLNSKSIVKFTEAQIFDITV
jgi:Cys-tRNA(Pro)/Cys-tRNA(Cys) deacylase